MSLEDADLELSELHPVVAVVDRDRLAGLVPRGGHDGTTGSTARCEMVGIGARHDVGGLGRRALVPDLGPRVDQQR